MIDLFFGGHRFIAFKFRIQKNEPGDGHIFLTHERETDDFTQP